jgi:MobA/VirD2-like, nuclease domain
MPKLMISALEGRPLLDVASYARHGPGRRDRLSPEEVALIGRTIGRTPEVMVKVLSKDSNNLRSVARHLNYIGRHGRLELETDDRERVQGRNAGQRLVEDWDLDLDQDRRDSRLAAGTGRAPKLVHKIMLSMPPGTPAKGVLEAARNFAREEFALKHRYALTLHTDEPHPHVHLVVKAVSEQGVRLNVRKATLRDWRQKFAEELRREGIAANATDRAVRGVSSAWKTDGIYRASLRGESRHVRDRLYAVASDLHKDDLRIDEGKSQLRATRSAVEQGWLALSAILADQGHADLAADVRRFVRDLPPPRTEQEQLAASVLERIRGVASRDSVITR